MEKPEKEQKKPRDREANWDPAEKEFLRECISMHLDIIENKGNDSAIIFKKKNSWEAIRAAMVSAGYDREIPKLKSQWVRMKVNARKAVANAKRASIISNNSIHLPELSIEDNLVQRMIKQEFDEDDILINSNYVETNNCVRSPIATECKDQDFRIDADKTPTIPHQYLADEIRKNKHESSPANTPQECFADDFRNNKEDSLSSKLHRLKNLPKTPSKNSVILERQRQIARESLYSEEINKLQKKQLIAEIEHLERMHEMQEIQQKELHALKLQQLQRQMDHDQELHTLKLDILKKIAASNPTSNLNI